MAKGGLDSLRRVVYKRIHIEEPSYLYAKKELNGTPTYQNQIDGGVRTSDGQGNLHMSDRAHWKNGKTSVELCLA
jgi:hypothetical protein